MTLTASEIKEMILEILPDAEVQVQDMRGDGSQFAAHVVSKEFIGKNRVQQHQMVYKAGSFHPRQSSRASPAKQSPQ